MPSLLGVQSRTSHSNRASTQLTETIYLLESVPPMAGNLAVSAGEEIQSAVLPERYAKYRSGFVPKGAWIQAVYAGLD